MADTNEVAAALKARLENIDRIVRAGARTRRGQGEVVEALKWLDLAGGAEIPLERLATLARARPELDMRAVVLELARRRAAATR